MIHLVNYNHGDESKESNVDHPSVGPLQEIFLFVPDWWSYFWFHEQSKAPSEDEYEIPPSIPLGGLPKCHPETLNGLWQMPYFQVKWHHFRLLIVNLSAGLYLSHFTKFHLGTKIYKNVLKAFLTTKIRFSWFITKRKYFWARNIDFIQPQGPKKGPFSDRYFFEQTE